MDTSISTQPEETVRVSIIDFLFETARLDPRTITPEKWMEVLQLVLASYRPRGKYFPFVAHKKEEVGILFQAYRLISYSSFWEIQTNLLSDPRLETGTLFYPVHSGIEGEMEGDHEMPADAMNAGGHPRLIPTGVMSASPEVIAQVFPVAGNKPVTFYLFLDPDMSTWWALKKYDMFIESGNARNEENRISHVMKIKEEEVLNMIRFNRFTAVQIMRCLCCLSEHAIQKRRNEADSWEECLVKNKALLAKLLS